MILSRCREKNHYIIMGSRTGLVMTVPLGDLALMGIKIYTCINFINKAF